MKMKNEGRVYNFFVLQRGSSVDDYIKVSNIALEALNKYKQIIQGCSNREWLRLPSNNEMYKKDAFFLRASDVSCYKVEIREEEK